MKKFLKRFAYLPMCFYLGSGAAMASDVSIATLEWPPYASPKLPKGGLSTAVVQMTLSAIGINSNIQTVPWKRAISLAKNNSSVDGYYPGYHCSHAEGFIASDPIGVGPLGLAEHTDTPISWNTLDDLSEQNLKIGTVLGYANTAAFDAKVDKGEIRAIKAKDDLTNLRKLMRKRVDAVVVDKLTLSYMLATESSLSGAKDKIVFDEQPLQVNKLHLCLVESERSREIMESFNKALLELDTENFAKQYFEKEF